MPTHPSLPGAPSSKRVFGLDLMRAAAILIVVDAHATIALGPYASPALWHQIVPDGVELFFVLSGFLIGGILIRLYEDSNRFGPPVLLGFWTRRWFRTLPAYYLVLIGLVAFALLRAWRSGMHHTLPAKATLLSYFVFGQNLASPVPDFFPETWSLAIEEWSYLTLPVVLWALHRLLPSDWSRRRVVLMTILLVIVGTNLYRYVSALLIPISAGELDYRGIVLSRLDAIAYGVGAAYVKHYYPIWWTNAWVQRLTGRLGLVLTVVAALSASIYMLQYYVNWGVYEHYVFYKRTFYFPFIGLSMALLMPYMDGWRTASGVWARFGLARAITHISLISYSMYLLNLTPIMMNVIERIPTTSPAMGWVKVGLFWALVLGLSTLLYTYFERPATALRDRLSVKGPGELAVNG